MKISSDVLSEDDLSLIHALQISPRASWSRLSAVLGRHPRALARRWEELRGRGEVWVTAYPSLRSLGDLHLAYVEVACAVEKLGELAQALVQEPSVISVDQASRDYNLVLTVVATSHTRLSEILMDDLPRGIGVRSLRTHIASQVHSDGSVWRIGALDASTEAAVQQTSGSATSPAAGRLLPWRQPWAELAHHLARDGRLGASELSRLTGRPEATVRRQLTTLLASRRLTFRCEIAQSLTGYPLHVNWWCRVPHPSIAHVVDHLRRHSTVRQTVTVPGYANLLVTSWLPHIEAAWTMQEYIESDLAPAIIRESAIVLRSHKRMQILLDPVGRRLGPVVPFIGTAHPPV